MALRRRARPIMLALGLFVFVLVAGALLVEEGEIVQLTTHDAALHELETQLWIVDLDGAEYLRAGRANARWLERIRVRPEVVLQRGEESVPRLAVPLDDRELRRRVDAAMARKYGLSDRLFRLLRDAKGSVPVRLDPVKDPAAPARGEPGRAQ